VELYAAPAKDAVVRGLIIADTKIEFGPLDGEPILVNEELTPDSSRYWLREDYDPISMIAGAEVSALWRASQQQQCPTIALIFVFVDVYIHSSMPSVIHRGALFFVGREVALRSPVLEARAESSEEVRELNLALRWDHHEELHEDRNEKTKLGRELRDNRADFAIGCKFGSVKKNSVSLGTNKSS
jgi:SAICAR synthetase